MHNSPNNYHPGQVDTKGSTRPSHKHSFFRLLQLAAASVFLGRAWQHIYWDAPYRTLLWDEAWMRPLVELWGLTWQEYATSPVTNQAIQQFIVYIGWFYVLCALAAIAVKPLGRWARGLLWVGSFGLVVLAALYCKEKFFFIGQFFEYSLQFSAPALLALVAARPQRMHNGRFITAIKVLVALTFTCHGLYAIGFYPRPGYFVSMTMNILPISEAGAVRFLIVAGVLDFLLSVLIFLPGRWAKVGLAYAVFWGTATTLARLWAHFDPSHLDGWLLHWLHESVMRFPHFLLPLLLLLLHFRNENGHQD